MWAQILGALGALILALLPLLVEWIGGRMRRQPPTEAEVLQAGQAQARKRLAEAMAAKDGDGIAAAFAHNKALLDGEDP